MSCLIVVSYEKGIFIFQPPVTAHPVGQINQNSLKRPIITRTLSLENLTLFAQRLYEIKGQRWFCNKIKGVTAHPLPAAV